MRESARGKKAIEENLCRKVGASKVDREIDAPWRLIKIRKFRTAKLFFLISLPFRSARSFSQNLDRNDFSRRNSIGQNFSLRVAAIQRRRRRRRGKKKRDGACSTDKSVEPRRGRAGY